MSVDDVVLVRLGAIPRTSSGKIRRSECRTRWLAGDPRRWPRPRPPRSRRRAPSAALPPDLLRLVTAELGTAPAALDPDVPLVAQGLDSLRAVRLLAALRRSTRSPCPSPPSSADSPPANSPASRSAINRSPPASGSGSRRNPSVSAVRSTGVRRPPAAGAAGTRRSPRSAIGRSPAAPAAGSRANRPPAAPGADRRAGADVAAGPDGSGRRLSHRGRTGHHRAAGHRCVPGVPLSADRHHPRVALGVPGGTRRPAHGGGPAGRRQPPAHGGGPARAAGRARPCGARA
ncbi:phosphopantetheine-binding protein [Streptomyces tricolor]|nr:phosphopantetheine-binding protein [Streptomyces tricolor]